MRNSSSFSYARAFVITTTLAGNVTLRLALVSSPCQRAGYAADNGTARVEPLRLNRAEKSGCGLWVGFGLSVLCVSALPALKGFPGERLC